MALVVADRIQETTATTGTGTYNLAGAKTGFASFAAVGDGNTTYYACTDDTNFEVGIGTFTASGTTLARTTILSSSNSNNAVSWSAGDKDIFVTLPSEKAVLEDASNNVAIGNNITVGGTVDGRDLAADGTKLDAIEANATADQTAAEIRTLVESASDSNVFTDADHTKLNGIEPNATADQTAAEIRTAVEAATDSNVFTDADHTKLNGIETSADVTDTANVTSAGALMDSEVQNLADVKNFDASDYATAAQGTLAANALPKSGGTMSGDIDGNGNKVLFANLYAQLSDLPSASTYHGMFAHVHATGLAYYAHGGAWIPLASLTGAAFTGAITTTSTFDGRDVATDGTKLDGIAASANNYVHPNHSGEVTSTADGATVIADNIVDEANLKVSNSPTNGYFLSAQSGNTGGLTWAAVSSVGGATGVDFNDNTKARFGTGNDLEIYHDGSNSYIDDSGTGRLYLRGNDRVQIQKYTGEDMITCNADGSVNLYYDNSKKFETTSSGASISGTCAVSNNITCSNTVTANTFNATSDATLKTNISPIENPLSILKKITGVSFDWKNNEGSAEGVLAQDVEQVLPNAVNTDEEGKKSVSYNNLVGVLIEAVKGQQEQINNLKDRLSGLSS